MTSGAAVFGITGRMGQCLIRALREPKAGEDAALCLTGALASESSRGLGEDAAFDGTPSGIIIRSDPLQALSGAAVALDFSLPQSVAVHARACAQARVALLMGVTGFDAASRAELHEAAQRIPVLIAANTSTGVTLVTELVALAAQHLGAEYDIEISDVHHRLKRDAPSGTALAWGEAAAAARGESLARVAVFDRHGLSEPRKAGSIGFASTRAGDVVGEHTVTFAAAGERIEITHRATDRMAFARGAVRAAAWLVARPPGVYSMKNVLGL